MQPFGGGNLGSYMSLPRIGPEEDMDADAQLGKRVLRNAINGVEYSPFVAGFRRGAAMTKRARNGGGEKGGTSRRQWNADQKLRIVIESLRSPEPNIEICRRHGISEPTLYKWRQQVFDGGKMYLSGTARSSADDLVEENRRLKEVISKTLLALENGLGGKSVRRSRRSRNGVGRTDG